MTTPARHYFLNEGHELSRAEKEGGGGKPKFGRIDWAKRGQILSQSLTAARQTMDRSLDPTTTDRLFLLATPVLAIPKLSDNKKKHPTGEFDERPSFAGKESLIFRRLGIDLVDVAATGEAVVHVTSQRVEKLLKTTAALEKEGEREQARWAPLDRFDVVPPHMKVDDSWLENISKSTPVESVIRLHASLTRIDIELVLRAITESILTEGETLIRAGRSFSGRPWFSAMLRRKSIERLTKEFPSIQAIHPPMLTALDGARKKSTAKSTQTAVPSTPPPLTTTPPSNLPVVGVLDCGIPQNHNLLGNFIRGRYTGRNSSAVAGDHASLVASRIVFGELNFYSGVSVPPPGNIAIVDVIVADPIHSTAAKTVIQDEDVVDAIGTVTTGNPEVRVFNLSFSGSPLHNDGRVETTERLIYAQDLDNFIFANDVVVIMSAGNSLGGMQPTKLYPDHIDDPQWKLGGWVSGISTLKCGAFVSHPVSTGIVNTVGWPSPFTRIGPPISQAAAPEFSAPGGDVGANYQSIPGGGVWCCSSTGEWEDHPGTSFAAPLLAREAALTVERLQKIAGRPFAALVRAVMTLTAARRGENTYTKPIAALAERSLGRGFPDSTVLATPRAERALIFWQGLLEASGDIARVQLPLPKAWLVKAKEPRVRLIVSWDPPVNHATPETWACREVTAQLRPAPNERALPPSKNARVRNSPLLDRTYNLSAVHLDEKGIDISDDLWVVELSYQEVAAYPVGVSIGPSQRVAFVAELTDDHESPTSPHDEIQKIKLTQTMTQLTNPILPLPTALLVTTK
ncbi:S8 family serine peptidase [Myxococcus eversor]|uniref:S8 family serine peptidase n=1 Tax=Myxococcus eversor TaxID=2709661 RepID=UPI0013D4A174|nr:S8 family serine peptidase [Myxococcus eversor]